MLPRSADRQIGLQNRGSAAQKTPIFVFADYHVFVFPIVDLVEFHAKFIRPAHYDDMLTIKTILKELPQDHRVEFFQEVYNEKEKLLTTGKAVLYFIDAKTRNKTNMPR